MFLTLFISDISIVLFMCAACVILGILLFYYLATVEITAPVHHYCLDTLGSAMLIAMPRNRAAMSTVRL